MDSKLDLFFYTENKRKEFKLLWTISDLLKIPGTLKSPKFSFFPELCFGDDWFLRIAICDVKSTSLSLHCGCLHNQRLRVEYTVTFRKPDGKWISEVSGYYIFAGSDSNILHSNLNDIVHLGSTDTLNLEFNFLIHGLDVKTTAVYYVGDDDGEFSVLPRSFHQLKQNRNLVDLKIHVGGKTFEVHKFILRLRTPKFVDEHLRDLSVSEIVLKDLQPELFEDILSYIYEAKSPLLSLKHCPVALYEVVNKYSLKSLQNSCVEKLQHFLNVENAVYYLKMAIKYQDDTFKMKISFFIRKNLDAMEKRSDWKILVISNPKLVEEIVINM